jgi:hypothetical protein
MSECKHEVVKLGTDVMVHGTESTNWRCDRCDVLFVPRSQLLSLQSQRDELLSFGRAAMEFAKAIRSCTGAPGLAGGGPCMRCQTEAGALLALGSTKTGLGT